ncbi:MAG: hypothetical protein K8R76_11610 [Candidatus Aegiribacteria sp.]|nr:hypothetical protein [Candidatus Aegiribacteria sp.]
MKILIISLTVITAAAFSDVLISDDFNDGNADGWLELPTGASYTVIEGRYCFSQTAPDSVYAISMNSDLFGSMSVSDYTCRTNVILNEGTMIGIVGRFDVILTQGYGIFIEISDTLSYLILVRIDGIGYGETLALEPCHLSYGQEYWLRLEMNGHFIGGKCWTGTSGDEPDIWNFTAIDSSYQEPGVFALFGYDSGDNATMDVSFDDVEITDETTLDLQSSSWAFLKAFFM